MEVEGGRGGDGCCHFRREKFAPRGGPDGGDGGGGGSVYLAADRHAATLAHLVRKKLYRAGHGAPGGREGSTGHSGEDVYLPVPLGTEVFDAHTQARLGEILSPKERLLVAKGGKGGRGNRAFATSTHQTPEEFEPGEPGEKRAIRLSLKLLADVGLVGAPNAGKSSLLAAWTRAQPKIAPYPFTTKVPHLGVVFWNRELSFVVADIPGLIAGAHQGRGLGTHFLAQAARTRLLLHLVDISWGGDVLEQVEMVASELRQADPRLLEKPQIFVLSKCDLPEVKKKKREAEKKLQEAYGREVRAVSTVSGEGLRDLLRAVVGELECSKEENFCADRGKSW